MATNRENLTFSQHSPSLRTFHTCLTDQQFSEKGLAFVRPSKSGKTISHFIGVDQSWDSPHSIVISVPTDYSDLIIDHRAAPAPKQVAWLPEFDARLNELDETAIEDEIEISLASRADAGAFAKRLYGVRQPSVFLAGNGNFRLRWTNGQGEKVGLQFRGDGDVQYIFFKQVADRTEHMLGIKLISTVEAFITACGMRHVIVE